VALFVDGHDKDCGYYSVWLEVDGLSLKAELRGLGGPYEVAEPPENSTFQSIVICSEESQTVRVLTSAGQTCEYNYVKTILPSKCE